jgi:FkbM family methyltransferase
MKSFTLLERLHFLHRRLRYAYRTEPDAVWFIRTLVSPKDSAIDIGANKGILSWFLASAVGPQGIVFAFEPQPELIPALEAVKSTYGLEQLEIIHKGLADSAGILSLYRERAGSTGTLKGGTLHSKQTIPVDVISLDQFLEERDAPRVNFIKCDVDGFEAQVFRGAIQTLAEDSPALLIEINETDLASMAKFLADYGYHECWFRHKNVVYAGCMTNRVPYRHKNARFRNFLFLHDSDPRKSNIK